MQSIKTPLGKLTLYMKEMLHWGQKCDGIPHFPTTQVSMTLWLKLVRRDTVGESFVLRHPSSRVCKEAGPHYFPPKVKRCLLLWVGAALLPSSLNTMVIFLGGSCLESNTAVACCDIAQITASIPSADKGYASKQLGCHGRCQKNYVDLGLDLNLTDFKNQGLLHIPQCPLWLYISPKTLSMIWSWPCNPPGESWAQYYLGGQTPWSPWSLLDF